MTKCRICGKDLGEEMINSEGYTDNPNIHYCGCFGISNPLCIECWNRTGGACPDCPEWNKDSYWRFLGKPKPTLV